MWVYAEDISTYSFSISVNNSSYIVLEQNVLEYVRIEVKSTHNAKIVPASISDIVWSTASIIKFIA